MRNLLLILLICACATGASAQSLLSINFETPDYSLGNLDGQQMWSPYPGFPPPDAQVVDNTSPVTPYEGDQCALLISTSATFCAEMYNAENDINDSMFNTNTHNLRVRMKIFPMSNYNACDLRIHPTNLVRLVLFGIWTDANTNAVANLNGTTLNIPVDQGEWHDLSVLLDCKNQQVIEFTVNSQVFPVTDRPFWAQAAYPQALRINTSDLLDAWTAFDAIEVTAEKKTTVDLFMCDFEDPPYTPGEIAGQQGWLPYPGFAPPYNAITNTNPDPAGGTQSAFLMSTNNAFGALMLGIEDAVNPSTFNTNTHNIRVSFDMYADSFYTAVDIRDNTNNRQRIVLLGIWDVANANPANPPINTPVDHGKWVHISADIDCKTKQTVRYTVDDKVFYPFIPFASGSASNLPQMLRMSTDGSGNGKASFDNFLVQSVPKPYYVSTTGNDGNSGLSPAEAFASFDMAMESCTHGDTIRILPGVYTNPFTTAYNNTNVPPNNITVYLGKHRAGDHINNLTMAGDTTTNTIFRYVGAGPGTGAERRIYAMGNNTVLRNLTLEGEFLGDSGYSYGIYLLYITNALFEDVCVKFPTNVFGWSGFGTLYTDCVWHPTIRNCLVAGGGLGIRDRHWNEWPDWGDNYRKSHELRVMNNTFVNQLSHPSRADEGSGVQIQNNRGALISGCIFDNCEESAVLLNTSANYPSNDIIVADCLWNNSASGFITQNNPEKNVVVTQGVIVQVDAQLQEYQGYAYSSPYEVFGWHTYPIETPVAIGPAPWPVNGNDIHRRGFYTGGDALETVQLAWLNTTQIGPYGAGIWGSGVADEDTFYISVDPYNAGEYELLALNLSDGTLKYGMQLEDWGNGTPALSHTMVIAADTSGHAYGINKATGVLVWKTELPNGAANGGILINNNRVFVEHDGGLSCLNAENGSILWTAPFVGDSWSGNGPSLSPDGNTIYIHTGGDPSAIKAFTTAQGQPVWSYDVKPGWGDLEPIVSSDGSVYAGAAGLLSAGDDNDYLICFNPTGGVVWTHDLGGDGIWWHGGYALSEDEATIYCSRRAGIGITAVNTADGTLKWNSTGVGDTLGGCVVGAGDIIMSCFYNPGTNATVHGIKDNGSQGDVLWSIILPTEGGSWSWPTLLADGDVIVESDGGAIARITAVSGSARAPEPWPLYGNGIQRKGYYTGGMTLGSVGIVWTNTAQIGPVSQGIYGSASADDTHLFVAVDPYNVDEYEMLAISLADGTLDYGSHFVDWVNGTPAVGVGYVYSGDNAGWVYCVNKADGAVIWSNHIGGDINSGINLNGGVVYAKAGGNGLYALNGDTGAPIWSNLNADASTWSGNGPSMNADGSKIYYKTETGDIVGVNTADGSTIFTDTSGANGWGGQDPIVDDGGSVYCQLRGLEAAPDDDVVVSLSPTGAVNWTYSFTGHVMNHGGLALSEDQATLYVSGDQGITALNTADGTEKWTTTNVNQLKGGIAVGAGNMIMGVARQGSTAPEATAVGVKDNGTSGDLVWQLPLDAGQDSWSGPVLLENGDVIVLTDGGEIARITVPEPGVVIALVFGLMLLIRRK